MRAGCCSPLSTALLALTLACGGGDDPPPVDTDEPLPPITDTAPELPTDTGTTDPTPVFDCSTVPVKPISITPLTNARGYHDVVFDPDDNILGTYSNALIKVAPDETVSVFTPMAGDTHQMVYLPDGDLAVSKVWTGEIVRVAPNGATTQLAPNVHAYGMIMGPDDMLYTANNSNIHRIDPTTGERTLYIPGAGYGPKVLEFNIDYTKLYVATIGGNGSVWYFDLNKAMEPISGPHLVASGLGNWHDGLGVDICGNIYLADYGTTALYRITPNGTVQTLLDPPLLNYGHGLRWGTGRAGWKETAIYMPMPYNDNKVVEVDIGVPYRTWQGNVIGEVPF